MVSLSCQAVNMLVSFNLKMEAAMHYDDRQVIDKEQRFEGFGIHVAQMRRK